MDGTLTVKQVSICFFTVGSLQQCTHYQVGYKLNINIAFALLFIGFWFLKADHQVYCSFNWFFWAKLTQTVFYTNKCTCWGHKKLCSLRDIQYTALCSGSETRTSCLIFETNQKRRSAIRRQRWIQSFFWLAETESMTSASCLFTNQRKLWINSETTKLPVNGWEALGRLRFVLCVRREVLDSLLEYTAV